MSTDLYRFKEIASVPGVKELIDIVLSRTQRKTPTEVHKQFKISRIRSFYMRKVKFCQQTFHDKLEGIVNQFPRLDEIHPFYSDLCNILYDRDHYKLALGQCNSMKSLIDNIAKDYIRLLKYADSLYKCKMLKKAALGRMCTAATKLKSCLPYLEEVRQHLGRLPSINPNTRTLILTGYPNVGKSSFMNLVSNANVEVQPYAFTTKSLYVGHFDYCYTRWQIIDTPGILDHPLEERNTVEMTAITALAHIQATVIYILDLSEECGYTLEAQVQLFHSIRPLFNKKPLVVLLNKVDKRPIESLTDEEKKLIESVKQANSTSILFFETSTLIGMGIDEAKNKSCDLLLDQRITVKSELKKAEKILDRLYVAEPKSNPLRPPNIPPTVITKLARLQEQEGNDQLAERKLEKHLENEMGGPGVYVYDLRKNHMLERDEWKYDIVPEFFNGKNVVDFIDPEIERRLEELEREEELLLTQDIPQLDEDYLKALKSIEDMHLETKRIVSIKKLQRSKRGLTLPQKIHNRKSKLKSLTSRLTKLKNSEETQGPTEVQDNSHIQSSFGSKEAKEPAKIIKKTINKQQNKSLLISSRQNIKNKRLLGISGPEQLKLVQKLQRSGQKRRNMRGMKGEGDHFIGTKKPKHLFSGKRGIGKTSHR